MGNDLALVWSFGDAALSGSTRHDCGFRGGAVRRLDAGRPTVRFDDVQRFAR